ncbi:hypothetical protein F5883DRAFT_118376 [Diaporthe sp. PMI_573]|nr:hypothetical protein F5883DRAFT_118376 [Diaporthaceae sp. PMI_573]
MGVAEIIPSSPKTTTPCRTSVCTCTSSGTGTDRHRLFISENKTNCNKARRGDYEHLLRGKSTARRSRHQNRLGRRFPAPSNGPTKIVKSIIAQDRKSFYPSKAALRYGLDNLCLTRCCFWAWEGGQSTEYATYWQGDSLGWLHRSGVATACNALQQRSSFSCSARADGPVTHGAKCCVAESIPQSIRLSRTAKSGLLTSDHIFRSRLQWSRHGAASLSTGDRRSTCWAGGTSEVPFFPSRQEARTTVNSHALSAEWEPRSVVGQRQHLRVRSSRGGTRAVSHSTLQICPVRGSKDGRVECFGRAACLSDLLPFGPQKQIPFSWNTAEQAGLWLVYRFLDHDQHGLACMLGYAACLICSGHPLGNVTPGPQSL